MPPTVNTFKNRLDKHWINQEVLYDYRATLNTLEPGSCNNMIKELDMQASKSSSSICLCLFCFN